MTNAEEIEAIRDKIERDLPVSAPRDEVRALLLSATSLLAKIESAEADADAASLAKKALSTMRPVEAQAWRALALAQKAAQAEVEAEALAEESRQLADPVATR